MQLVQWIFTAGVAIAVLCDVLITGSLCYYLHSVSDHSFLRNVVHNSQLLRLKSRGASKGSVHRLSGEMRDTSDHVTRMNDIIDEIILYTIENGSLTWYVALFCVVRCLKHCTFSPQCFFYRLSHLRKFSTNVSWTQE